MAQNLWLPSYFSSGMVLQQQMPVYLHGRFRPKQTIFCKLERQPFDDRPVSPLDKDYGLIHEGSVEADDRGAFCLELPAFEASLDPFTLTIQGGRQTRVFEDVLFGEVWLSGGQSNMAMPLRATRAKDNLETLANVPYVRVLTQAADGLSRKTKTYEYQPLSDLVSAKWIYGDQQDAVSQVSAVAFSFARALHIELKIPVGVIESAVGGSLIQSWISRDSIESSQAIKTHIEKGGFYRSQADWNMNSDPEWNAKQPAALYNHKIAPLKDLALRGLLWYQGESDFTSPDYYREALKILTRDWQSLLRPASDQGLQFLYVQLAPWYSGQRDPFKLSEFNEMLSAVRRQLPCPSALLPSYQPLPTFDQAPEDWRHPVHPDNKVPIGERLQALALGLCYERKRLSQAPECIEIEQVGNKLMLSFEPVGEGLRVVSGAQRLRGFAICGPDRLFLEAQAKLLYGVRVLVWHEQIDKPEAVTYAFNDLNQDANLVSQELIPVMPFRSDLKPSRYALPAEWTHCEALSIWACPKLENPLETGWHPAWQTFKGKSNFKVEPANKTEGDASFHITYQTDEDHLFEFGPVINYDSCYPPSDWQPFDTLSLDVFNADQQMKSLSLSLLLTGDESAVLPEKKIVIAALRWQTIKFKLTTLTPEQKSSIKGVSFMLEDRKNKGEIYLDHIRLARPESK